MNNHNGTCDDQYNTEHLRLSLQRYCHYLTVALKFYCIKQLRLVTEGLAIVCTPFSGLTSNSKDWTQTLTMDTPIISRKLDGVEIVNIEHGWSLQVTTNIEPCNEIQYLYIPFDDNSMECFCILRIMYEDKKPFVSVDHSFISQLYVSGTNHVMKKVKEQLINQFQTQQHEWNVGGPVSLNETKVYLNLKRISPIEVENLQAVSIDHLVGPNRGGQPNFITIQCSTKENIAKYINGMACRDVKITFTPTERSIGVVLDPILLYAVVMDEKIGRIGFLTPKTTIHGTFECVISLMINNVKVGSQERLIYKFVESEPTQDTSLSIVDIPNDMIYIGYVNVFEAFSFDLFKNNRNFESFAKSHVDTFDIFGLNLLAHLKLRLQTESTNGSLFEFMRILNYEEMEPILASIYNVENTSASVGTVTQSTTDTNTQMKEMEDIDSRLKSLQLLTTQYSLRPDHVRLVLSKLDLDTSSLPMDTIIEKVASSICAFGWLRREMNITKKHTRNDKAPYLEIRVILYQKNKPNPEAEQTNEIPKLKSCIMMGKYVYEFYETGFVKGTDHEKKENGFFHFKSFYSSLVATIRTNDQLEKLLNNFSQFNASWNGSMQYHDVMCNESHWSILALKHLELWETMDSVTTQYLRDICQRHALSLVFPISVDYFYTNSNGIRDGLFGIAESAKWKQPIVEFLSCTCGDCQVVEFDGLSDLSIFCNFYVDNGRAYMKTEAGTKSLRLLRNIVWTNLLSDYVENQKLFQQELLAKLEPTSSVHHFTYQRVAYNVPCYNAAAYEDKEKKFCEEVKAEVEKLVK